MWGCNKMLSCPCCCAPRDALEIVRPITTGCVYKCRCGTKFKLRVNHPGCESGETYRAFAWRSAKLGFEARRTAFEERLAAAKLALYAIEACIEATKNKISEFVRLGEVLELVPTWQKLVVASVLRATGYSPVVTPDHRATILLRADHFDWLGHEDSKPLDGAYNADVHLAVWRGVAAFAEAAAGLLDASAPALRRGHVPLGNLRLTPGLEAILAELVWLASGQCLVWHRDNAFWYSP